MLLIVAPCTSSGEPNSVTALGPNKAEMTTSTGAIYFTENAGRNWKAMVKETIDATLNRITSSGVTGASYFTGSVSTLKRDKDGAYLSVRLVMKEVCLFHVCHAISWFLREASV